MTIKSWILPHGDVYRVVTTPRGTHVLYRSYVIRESGNTLCCSGTYSIETIRLYYDEVCVAQREALEGRYAEYWREYRRRRGAHQIKVARAAK